MKYFTCEIQNSSLTPYSYDTLEDAIEKFYQILTFACKSTVEHHGAMIVGSDGITYESRFFKHPQTAE